MMRAARSAGDSSVGVGSAVMLSVDSREKRRCAGRGIARSNALGLRWRMPDDELSARGAGDVTEYIRVPAPVLRFARKARTWNQEPLRASRHQPRPFGESATSPFLACT